MIAQKTEGRSKADPTAIALEAGEYLDHNASVPTSNALRIAGQSLLEGLFH